MSVLLEKIADQLHYDISVIEETTGSFRIKKTTYMLKFKEDRGKNA